MSIQLGRPRMINATDSTVKPPIDTDIPMDPSRTLVRPAQSNESPSDFTASLIKYDLACRIHKLMSLGALSSACPDYRIIARTHTEVKNLLVSLPPVLRQDPGLGDRSWDFQKPNIVRHRLTIPIIINSFLLALHRPHVLSYRTSSDASIEAARKILNLSQQLFEITSKHQHKTYTLVFYTIDTGILLSAIMLSRRRESSWTLPVEDWNSLCSALQQSILRLRVLKESNSVADTGERVLQKCLARLLEPDGSQPNTADPGSNIFNDQFDTQGVIPLWQSMGSAQSYNTRYGSFVASPHQANTPGLSDSTAPPEASEDVLLDPFSRPDAFNNIINNYSFTGTWLDQHMDARPSDEGMQDDVDYDVE